MPGPGPVREERWTMLATETVFCGSETGLHIRAVVHVMDNGDLVIVVTGGRDHVGAVALALPRPSLKDPERTSASSSVLTMPGHKEDVLVKEISEKVAAGTGRNVMVVGGVHYDNLDERQLATLHRLWLKLIDKIIAILVNNK